MTIQTVLPAGADNSIPIEAWNTVLFEKFCRFRHVLSHGLSGHSDELFRRKPFPAGARVLDVGCGFGDTTRRIAAQVGPGGEAVGVDGAQNFIDTATREAGEASLKNASFFVADAQCDDLRGPYDHIFSRFGTMFFYLPGLALRNMRRALAPGGELSMIVWRRREDNPWVHEAELRVRQIVPVVAHRGHRSGALRPGPVLDGRSRHGERHAAGRRVTSTSPLRATTPTSALVAPWTMRSSSPWRWDRRGRSSGLREKPVTG